VIGFHHSGESKRGRPVATGSAIELTLTVRLSDDGTNGFIIADGARIELVNLTPKIGNLQGGPNPNVAGAVLNLRAADVEDDGSVVASVDCVWR
jgi:hypothetical protein